MQELLSSLVEELEQTDFDILLERYTDIGRGWFGLGRAKRRYREHFEVVPGPRGGMYGVETWAVLEGEDDVLHIFVTVQSHDDPDIEATKNFLVYRSDRQG